MTSLYIRRTPIDDSKAPCFPEARREFCLTCTRWRSAMPVPAERRQFVVIDASLFILDNVCPMYEARPSANSFHDPAHARISTPEAA